MYRESSFRRLDLIPIGKNCHRAVDSYSQSWDRLDAARRPMYEYGMFSTRLICCDWTVATKFNCSIDPHNRGLAIHPHLQCYRLVKIPDDNQSCADSDLVNLFAVFVFQRLHVSFGVQEPRYISVSE